MKTATVIGGGMAGCVWALVLADRGWEVTVIERAPFLGGGCKTFWWGGHPYTFGPRHLFTAHEHVFDWLCERIPLRRLHHFLLTYVERDGQFYSYPQHEDDIPKMPDRDQIYAELAERPDPATARNFEEYWIYSVGAILYEKFVKNYSEKMWEIDDNSLLTDFKFDGKGVKLQSGSREVRSEFFIAYPRDETGWDRIFEVTESTPGVTVRLSTNIDEFAPLNASVRVGDEWIRSDILVSSISPDALFNFEYGELQYMGRDFYKLVLPVEQVIPDPIYFLHYANDEAFTRVVEYKKLTGHKAPTTLLGMEIPSRRNKLYPYPVKEQQDLADRYFREMPDNLFSVGRMGNYRYNDIGMIVDEALKKTRDM